MPSTDGAENSMNELATVALSGEPARAARSSAMSARVTSLWARRKAVRAVGVSLKLAAFHPDRLIRAEMIDFG
jgi:hypothetical protein